MPNHNDGKTGQGNAPDVFIAALMPDGDYGVYRNGKIYEDGIRSRSAAEELAKIKNEEQHLFVKLPTHTAPIENEDTRTNAPRILPRNVKLELRNALNAVDTKILLMRSLTIDYCFVAPAKEIAKAKRVRAAVLKANDLIAKALKEVE